MRVEGGIYAKAAALVLTPDNQVAELYDPSVFSKEAQPPKFRMVLKRAYSKLRRWIRRFVVWF
jgi:hypothetical protein